MGRIEAQRHHSQQQIQWSPRAKDCSKPRMRITVGREERSISTGICGRRFRQLSGAAELVEHLKRSHLGMPILIEITALVARHITQVLFGERLVILENHHIIAVF